MIGLKMTTLFSLYHNASQGILRCIHSSVVRSSVIKVYDDSWRPVKEKYMKMDIDDKRLQYFVKGNYLDMDRIRPWPVYFEHMKIPPTTQKRKYPVKFPVNYRVTMGQGNIVGLELDAIVNPTSLDMMGTGGACDKIVHMAAGKELTLECATLRGCDIGEAKITGGYRLPAKYIIHTVGPNEESQAQLTACYNSCLEVMQLNQLKTIAFPCISTETNHFPPETAARIALSAVRRFLEKHPDDVDRICFCIHRDEDLQVYRELMQVYFPLHD